MAPFIWRLYVRTQKRDNHEMAIILFRYKNDRKYFIISRQNIHFMCNNQIRMHFPKVGMDHECLKHPRGNVSFSWNKLSFKSQDLNH